MEKQAITSLHELGAPHQETRVWPYMRDARLAVLLSVPIIYACAIPFIALDLMVTVYQSICFPIYRIPRVRRADYLIFDRGRLAYLNAVEKVHCVYCSYANGLLAYVTEIAARTEQYFCPIKHASRPPREHSRYQGFLPFGDAQAYRTQGDSVSQDWDDLTKDDANKPCRPPPVELD